MRYLEGVAFFRFWLIWEGFCNHACNQILRPKARDTYRSVERGSGRELVQAAKIATARSSGRITERRSSRWNRLLASQPGFHPGCSILQRQRPGARSMTPTFGAVRSVTATSVALSLTELATRSYQLTTLYDRLRKAGMLAVEEMAQVLEINPQAVKIWNRHGLVRGTPKMARTTASKSTPARMGRGKPTASNYRNGLLPAWSLRNVWRSRSVKRKPWLWAPAP